MAGTSMLPSRLMASPIRDQRPTCVSPLHHPWQGVMIGVGAPGLIVGGAAGGLVGGLAAPLSHANSEGYWVGMVSTGAWIGGSVGLGMAGMWLSHSLGSIMDPIVASALVATLGMGYWSHVIGTAFDAAHSIRQQSDDDAVQHRWVMGQVSQQADPIAALMIGSLKESADFWLGTGHPEWRDWHHNWLGIIKGATP